MAFRVKDIPNPIQLPGQINVFSFRVEHTPICGDKEENYSHSDVQMLKNGVFRKRNFKPPDEVKKYYRTKLALAKSTEVVIEPTI